jgi:hypothetical protein
MTLAFMGLAAFQEDSVTWPFLAALAACSRALREGGEEGGAGGRQRRV